MAFRPSLYSLSYYVGIRHLGQVLDTHFVYRDGDAFEEGTFYADIRTNVIQGAENNRLLAEAMYDPLFAAWAAVNAA